MTLSPKLGVVEISTLWHFRLPLPIQMFIKIASSPKLSGIGMPSPILWSHPLKMQRIVLLSSPLWWELGTNSLITGPGEWLSFRRFTSKLSWFWSWWEWYLRASIWVPGRILSAPDDWKKASVSAVFKKGQCYDPANHRPVSLTCLCSKMVEQNWAAT